MCGECRRPTTVRNDILPSTRPTDVSGIRHIVVVYNCCCYNSQQNRDIVIYSVSISLCATDFGEFYGDVIQALPECTVEQTHDKHMVQQYYSDTCYLMGTHEVNQDQVAMLISKLSKNESPGLDGVTAEHLIYGKSSLLCSLLVSLYNSILSRSCVPTLFTTGLIVPILKKSTLNANIAKYYRPITRSSIHTKMVEALILPDTGLSDTQFGFREN